MSYRKPTGAWTRDLAWANSLDTRAESLWSELGYTDFARSPDGHDAQRAGVDRTCTWVNPELMPEGCELNLQEKIRCRRFSGDVLFELDHVHTDGRVRRGWARALPAADYIGWLWLPKVGRDVLVAASVMHVREYMEWFTKNRHRVPARFFIESGRNNPGYVTRSVCVPLDALRARIPLQVVKKPPTNVDG